jgi:hypothetical protein
MPKVEGAPDHNNMKDPPAWFIPHKISEHLISREDGRVCIQPLFPKDE